MDARMMPRRRIKNLPREWTPMVFPTGVHKRVAINTRTGSPTPMRLLAPSEVALCNTVQAAEGHIPSTPRRAQ